MRGIPWRPRSGVVTDLVQNGLTSEAKATFEVATLEIAGANRAVGKVHKLVLLSEGVAKDPMLARQLRRKFV